jgi:hypothetical protein
MRSTQYIIQRTYSIDSFVDRIEHEVVISIQLFFRQLGLSQGQK